MNRQRRAIAELRSLPRLGGMRLGVAAPPSTAPLKTRLAFLTRWANALGVALGQLPPGDKSKPVSPKNPRGGKRGPAARRLWSRIKGRYLQERDKYLGFIADPKSDSLDELARAPVQLDQWEVTFAAFGRSLEKLGGRAPDFQVGPGQAKLVGPRVTKILGAMAGQAAAGVKERAKRAGEAVSESAKDFADTVGGAVSKGASWLGWLTAISAVVGIVYYGHRMVRDQELEDQRQLAELRRAQRDAEMRRLFAERNELLARHLELSG